MLQSQVTRSHHKDRLLASHGQLIDPAKMREYIPLEAGAGGGGRFSPDTVTAMVARQPLVEPARHLRGYGEPRWLGGWGKQQGWQVVSKYQHEGGCFTAVYRSPEPSRQTPVSLELLLSAGH